MMKANKLDIVLPTTPREDLVRFVRNRFGTPKLNGRFFSFYPVLSKLDIFLDPERTGVSSRHLAEAADTLERFVAYALTVEEEVAEQYNLSTDSKLPKGTAAIFAINLASSFFATQNRHKINGFDYVGNLEVILNQDYSKGLRDIFPDAVAFRTRKDFEYLSKQRNYLRFKEEIVFAYLSNFFSALRDKTKPRVEKLQESLDYALNFIVEGGEGTKINIGVPEINVNGNGSTVEERDIEEGVGIYDWIEPIGLDEQIQKVIARANFILRYDVRKRINPLKTGAKANSYMPRVILHGPPGTGKSMIAHRVHRYLQRRAKERGIPYRLIHISNLDKSSYVNESAKNIMAKLSRVKEGDAIYLIFVEEIDTVFFNDTHSNNEDIKVYGEMVAFIEGGVDAVDRGNYLLIGTTNYVDRIPPSLRNRFKLIYVGPVNNKSDFHRLVDQFFEPFYRFDMVDREFVYKHLDRLMGKIVGRDIKLLSSDLWDIVFENLPDSIPAESLDEYVRGNAELAKRAQEEILKFVENY